jgi:DNA-binding LacI/PurR family transcriptional regulator
VSAVRTEDPSATLADVAQAAGVSSATASRVLNGSPRVRPGTRRRVEEAMARLGYVRNRAAKGAKPQSTGSIALVACEEGSRIFSDPFFPRVIWGISRVLAPADLQLVLLMVRSSDDHRAAARYLRSGHVDGALFVSMHGQHPFDLEDLGLPVTLVGRPFSDGGTLSYVDADNRGGAESAVRHLIAGGRTRVATVAGPQDMVPGIDRLAGYQLAVKEAGMSDPGLVVHGDFSQMSGQHALCRLLDRRPGLDAVFAASDLMATGVLRALHRAGRRVPDDVAVVGFDDSPLARHTDPRLTTVRQPVDELGAQATRELLALVAQTAEGPHQIVLPTELVRRESA